MALIFIDLDRTLISRNSAPMWVKWELRGGFISRMQALRAAGWVLRYHMGESDLELPLRRSIATLEGQSEAALEKRTADFYQAWIRHLVRPGATAAIHQHRAAGDEVVLHTSSSNYLSAHITQDNALDGYISTRFAVGEDGNFTGGVEGPLSFGPGKVDLAAAYCRKRGERLEQTVFYTDSYSDLPLLEVVGTPVAVNPDLRLRRVARRRGWRVVDWGEG